MAKKRYIVSKIRKVSVLFFLAVLCNFKPIYAQIKPPVEYQVKAAFLFNFTRFINWPGAAYSSPDAAFVIGIVGNDPFGPYLDDLVKDEQVDGHPITVQRYPDNGEVSGCHILFINIHDQAKLKALISQTIHQDVLTVGDTDNFIKLGGMVRFFKDDNRIKMQIKLAAAKAAQLDISVKLLKVAQVN